ncbi:hypothetical protein V5O48_008421 [Marasmius crinis-equi]|uniref:chitin deacetylase n=1 Tax=Marasmius crinis-equi TaxID=585013 RepID=A0ABR3FDX3_9AGAR
MIFDKVLATATLAFTVRLASARTVAEQSAIVDPSEQCKYYDHPDVSKQLASFPKTWETARIVAGDSTARSKFDAMSAGIPNLPLKGSKARPTYDAKNDPDCWWTATLCTKAKHDGVPDDLSLVPEPQTLGYGFDDGPNCSHNAFYQYLTDQKQKATMFFIGSNVVGWPLQAKRAIDDGHEVCVHTWSHQELTGLGNEEVFAELYYTIKLVTGATPTCFRPPLGDIDDRVRYIAKNVGLRTILWKYDTYDTIPDQTTKQVEVASVRKNYESFLTTAKSGAFEREGAILLAHETNNMTMQEAVSYYPQLKAAFKHIVPVAVALNITQPYVENQFSMPTFQEYISGTIKTEGPHTSPNPGHPSSTSSGAGSTASSNSNLGKNGASQLLSSTILMGLFSAPLLASML